MTEKQKKSATGWVDPDDAPEWSDAMLDRAELAEDGEIIRPAAGTVTRGRGRPPAENPKERLTLRLDADVVRHFRESGTGWQTRINEALRKAIRKAG